MSEYKMIRVFKILLSVIMVLNGYVSELFFRDTH